MNKIKMINNGSAVYLTSGRVTFHIWEDVWYGISWKIWAQMQRIGVFDWLGIPRK